MTDRFATLTSIEPPWLLCTASELSELGRELDQLKAAGFATCLLDGSRMRSLMGVFGEFAKGLEFPDYFGFNSAAFEECLCDLSWLAVKGVCVVVLNAEQLLVDEVSEIGWLLQLLEDVGKEWSEAIEVGEAWDRDAVAFHVVFHVAIGSAEQFQPQLAVLPEEN